MARRLSALLFCLVSALPIAAQDSQAPAAKKLRVHIIGASVSGGFRDGPLFGAKEQGDSVTLQQVLKAWAGDDARVTTHDTTSMTTMFMNPLATGKDEVDKALRVKPDVVIAIDFPFWFAYGHMSGDEAKAREEKLAQGLAMLAQFQVPVLIGDLPDMQGAARRMLSPRQIPSPEMLKTLNAQIAAFAKAHDNLHVMSLSTMVRRMKDEGTDLPLATGALHTAPGALQQEDHLHATRLGMAYLGFSLQDALHGLFAKEHPLHERTWTFEKFVEAAGADGDLEQCQAAAKADKKEPAKAKPEGAGGSK